MTSDTRALTSDLAAREELDALVRRAQEGDAGAFEEILDRFEGKAILIARSMGARRQAAEDVAQEAFLKLFRYIGSYRSGNSFKGYFYRMVINAARDHLSRMGPAGQADLEEVTEVAADQPRAAFEDVEMLRRALAQL